jgi:hypothetical protein
VNTLRLVALCPQDEQRLYKVLFRLVIALTDWSTVRDSRCNNRNELQSVGVRRLQQDLNLGGS